MKITKQRLKEIIKEELEYVGAEIDQFKQPEAEDDSSHVAELLGTPEGTAIAKVMARKIIDQFASFPELADAIEGLDRDEVTARTVAAMRDNPMYDPMDETATEADIVRLMNAEKITRPQARVKLGLPANKRNPNQTRGASTKPNQGRFGGY
jgi:hypothetical protein